MGDQGMDERIAFGYLASGRVYQIKHDLIVVLCEGYPMFGAERCDQ